MQRKPKWFYSLSIYNYIITRAFPGLTMVSIYPEGQNNGIDEIKANAEQYRY